jgi:hypothetical protein
MQYDKTDMQAKANKWLDTNEGHEDFDEVQSLLVKIGDMPEGQRLQRFLSNLHTFIKGTRLTVTLTQEEEAEKAVIVASLVEIMTAVPNLVMPRIRTTENFETKVEDAIKDRRKSA